MKSAVMVTPNRDFRMDSPPSGSSGLHYTTFIPLLEQRAHGSATDLSARLEHGFKCVSQFCFWFNRVRWTFAKDLLARFYSGHVAAPRS
jgi:hypothetical protein